ncbi:barstar family protein [Eikenella halliae]|uniref:barstar family protein n=1 Tax=Eikenella halliae TaxID=1795832 RepID=UPI00370D1B7C
MSRFIRQTLIRPDALAISVDLSRIKTPHSLMQRMQEAFELPAYFSGSLDSLNDCMRDLDWLPQRKIHIAFCGLTDLKQRQPKLFADIADCLELYAIIGTATRRSIKSCGFR